MSYALIHKVALPFPVTSSPLFRRHWGRFLDEATAGLRADFAVRQRAHSVSPDAQGMSSFGSGTGGGQRSIASRFIAKSILMYSFVVVKPTCPSQDLMTLVSILD